MELSFIKTLKPTCSTKEKEIQILRALATCSVVFIHLINIGLRNNERGEFNHLFFQLINSLLQFAVPCFIFISGMVLAYSFHHKKFSFIDYYKKKLLYIFTPYFLWTLIYILIKIASGEIAFYKLFRPQSWFYWLAYGKAHTHLYFMSVILQFYIVAPFVYFSLKKICDLIKKHQLLVISFIAFVPQVLFYWFNRIYIYSYFSSTATLFPWYWCLCVWGFWIGLHYKEWQIPVEKYKKFLQVIGTLSIFAYFAYQIALYNGIKINTFYYQMVWYAYVLTVSVGLFYKICQTKLSSSLEDFLLWIGENSLAIYFIHPLFTYLLSQMIILSNPILLTILLVFLLFVLIIVTGKITCFLKRHSLIWILTGQKKEKVSMK